MPIAKTDHGSVKGETVLLAGSASRLRKSVLNMATLKDVACFFAKEGQARQPLVSTHHEDKGQVNQAKEHIKG